MIFPKHKSDPITPCLKPLIGFCWVSTDPVSGVANCFMTCAAQLPSCPLHPFPNPTFYSFKLNSFLFLEFQSCLFIFLPCSLALITSVFLRIFVTVPSLSCVSLCVLQHMYGGLRTSFRSFSPSALLRKQGVFCFCMLHTQLAGRRASRWFPCLYLPSRWRRLEMRIIASLYMRWGGGDELGSWTGIIRLVWLVHGLYLLSHLPGPLHVLLILNLFFFLLIPSCPSSCPLQLPYLVASSIH